jgi:hypothetical protein
VITERFKVKATTIKAKVWQETKNFAVVFAYVWAISCLFSLHKAYILQLNVLSGQTIAIFNAFVLGKVIVLLELFKVGDIFPARRPIFRVVIKSIVFGMMLLIFRILEAWILGCIHGETLTESMEEIHGGRLMEMVTLAIMMIMALLPFFTLNEISRSIGRERLIEILFHVPRAAPVPKV